ncbi:hypothetical protein [Polaromonas sp. AER18D-145]|uniref:hypothetical protein n=1 Tax=Polaromonas sp. AER18D-145 TaxID=1977060 RepID=UPI000BBCF34E|nr:hypothetical protein [Polaromonas sp. AER18D-145]
MKVLKRFSIILAFGASVLLSACSKTVQWEEEVLLNTGQTIWVKRTVVYSRQGGAGNPLDTAYRPEKDQALEFTWKGKTFHYKGEARIMVLAVSPHGQPSLIAPAEANSWNWRHKYLCTAPFYVQLVPDENGKNWTWPTSIEPWLYNLPTNLLLDIGDPNKMETKYLQAEKMKQPFWTDPQSQYMQKIDPAFNGDLCKKKEK